MDVVRIFWDSEGILLVECLDRAATINSVIWANIKVKTMELMGSTGQKDESSPHPP
jgi:hypothetical protein